MKLDCNRCHRLTVFRRINRRGWWQRAVLSRWFGVYPWECVQCRSTRLLRNSGHGSGSDNAGNFTPH